MGATDPSSLIGHSLFSKDMQVTVTESKGETKLKATVEENGHVYTLLKITVTDAKPSERAAKLRESLDKIQEHMGGLQLGNLDKRSQADTVSRMKSDNLAVKSSKQSKIFKAISQIVNKFKSQFGESPSRLSKMITPRNSDRRVSTDRGSAEATSRSAIMKEVINGMDADQVGKQIETLRNSLGSLAGHAKTLKNPSSKESLIFKNGEYSLTSNKLSEKEVRDTNFQIRNDLDDLIALTAKQGTSVTNMKFIDPSSNREVAFTAVLDRLGVVANDNTVLTSQKLQSYDFIVTVQQYENTARQINESMSTDGAKKALAGLSEGCSEAWLNTLRSIKDGTPEIMTFKQLVGLQDHEFSLPNQAKSVETLERKFIDAPDSTIGEQIQNSKDNIWEPGLKKAQDLLATHFEEFAGREEIPTREELSTAVNNQKKEKHAEIEAKYESIESSLRPDELTEGKKAELTKLKDMEIAEVDHLYDKQILVPLLNYPANIKKAEDFLSGITPPDYQTASAYASSPASALSETLTTAIGAINSALTEYCRNNYGPLSIRTIKLGQANNEENERTQRRMTETHPKMNFEHFKEARQEINDICEAFGKDTSSKNFAFLMGKINAFIAEFPPQTNRR